MIEYWYHLAPSYFYIKLQVPAENKNIIFDAQLNHTRKNLTTQVLGSFQTSIKNLKTLSADF